MRKYMYLFFFCFLFVFFLIIGCYGIKPVNNELELFGKVIYLDAGHGGTDPGAIYGNVNESKINLEIANLLRQKLSDCGAIVYMTRLYDNDLSKPRSYLRKRSDLFNRARLIDSSGADMYISIHLNASSNTNWSGAQVFYDDINENNVVLANVVQNQFAKDLKSTRKVKEISELYMYKNTKTLGILAEVGFLSNPNERYLLQKKSYQEKISESLKTAIINYYKGL